MRAKGLNAPHPNMKKFAKKMSKYKRIPKTGGKNASKKKNY
tara:strand:+ start:539 stop:661 length:123 start_codon:yes stop_codon:yes gene_type:complete